MPRVWLACCMLVAQRRKHVRVALVVWLSRDGMAELLVALASLVCCETSIVEAIRPYQRAHLTLVGLAPGGSRPTILGPVIVCGHPADGGGLKEHTSCLKGALSVGSTLTRHTMGWGNLPDFAHLALTGDKSTVIMKVIAPFRKP